MNLGGPQMFRQWEIRQLIVGGITWETTVAGSCDVFVQPSDPSARNPVALLNMVDNSSTLPNKAYYSGGQLRVRHPAQVFVAIISGTASTQYQATGAAFDLPDRAVLAVVEI